jgi:molybdopterin biosynthesis enzyme
VNLVSRQTGVLRVDASRLAQLNSYSGITLATMLSESAVHGGEIVATVKVLPFALPEETVLAAEELAAAGRPMLSVDPLPARQVALIFSGSPSARERVLRGFERPLRSRLEVLNATVAAVEFVPLEDTQDELELSRRLQALVATEIDLVILAGETAIMDSQDIAPRAIVNAGGEVCCYGAPVDPGNLLLLAYLHGVPVLGAPGCVRSPKRNIVDKILPRLLAGDRLTTSEIASWGHGGLVEEVHERPYPRSKVDARKTENDE